jgi:hypothetical protein
MRHESPERSNQPEQFVLFPEDAEFVAVMEEIREEEAKKGHPLPLNDEGLKEAAARRLAFRESGKKSYEYHGRNSE